MSYCYKCENPPTLCKCGEPITDEVEYRTWSRKIIAELHSKLNNRWVPVEHGVPDWGEDCLALCVWLHNGHEDTLQNILQRDSCDTAAPRTVTQWMKVPEPPLPQEIEQ